MVIIACIDDNNGIGFNKRRLSTDSTVSKDIANIVGDKILYVKSEYSKKLLSDYVKNIKILDENSELEDNYVFIDNNLMSFNEEVIKGIVTFGWNRKYPSDTKFIIDTNIWKAFSIVEYAGNSHDLITKTLYMKNKAKEERNDEN